MGSDDEKHGAGAHGRKGEGPEHGKPGHKHQDGEGGPRPGRRGGKRGGRGKKRADDDEDSSDEDSEEEDDDDDCADDEEEDKYPGLRRAGRVAAKKWKKENDLVGTKVKAMTSEQKEQIRAAKKQARIHFRTEARKEARKEG